MEASFRWLIVLVPSTTGSSHRSAHRCVPSVSAGLLMESSLHGLGGICRRRGQVDGVFLAPLVAITGAACSLGPLLRQSPCWGDYPLPPRKGKIYRHVLFLFPRSQVVLGNAFVREVALSFPRSQVVLGNAFVREVALRLPLPLPDFPLRLGGFCVRLFPLPFPSATSADNLPPAPPPPIFSVALRLLRVSVLNFRSPSP